MRRGLRALAIVAAGGGLALWASAPALADERWCIDGDAPPCVTSATLDGTALSSANPIYDIDTFATVGGPGEASGMDWSILDTTSPDALELGASALGQVWVITWNLGGVVPRVAYIRGDEAEVSRDDSGVAHSITVGASPALATDNAECDPSADPWFCPETAASQREAYLAGQVTDYATWTDVAERGSFYGMDLATNIGLSSTPPEIEEDPVTGGQRLLLRLANQHFLTNGTTIFEGDAMIRIPALFLSRVYGIDNPSALIGPGVTVTGASGGTSSVVADPGGEAVTVKVAGLTFSERKLKIEGFRITPTRPTRLRAKRKGQFTGRISFRKSKSRGSTVRRYQALCRAGGDLELRRSQGSPIRVGGLTPDTKYRCTVRAVSRAGDGTAARIVIPRD